MTMKLRGINKPISSKIGLSDPIIDDKEIFLEEKDFDSVKVSNPSPKELLKKFLLENIEYEPYIIVINGDKEDGDYFLHRMRNELSRFRAKLIERGQVVKKFKIICKSIAAKDDGTCEIIIIRTDKMESKSDDDLDDLLEQLAL